MGAAICQRLDGMPLAIELAARLVRLMPVEEILSRLRTPQRAMVNGQRGLQKGDGAEAQI